MGPVEELLNERTRLACYVLARLGLEQGAPGVREALRGVDDLYAQTA